MTVAAIVEAVVVDSPFVMEGRRMWKEALGPTTSKGSKPRTSENQADGPKKTDTQHHRKANVVVGN